MENISKINHLNFHFNPKKKRRMRRRGMKGRRRGERQGGEGERRNWKEE